MAEGHQQNTHDGPSMGAARASEQAPRAASLLAAHEIQAYRYAIEMRDEQQTRIGLARAALEREEFLGAAIDDRCTAQWLEICATHGLDAEAEYKVDESGLVYIANREED